MSKENGKPLMHVGACSCEYVTTYEQAAWGPSVELQEYEYVTRRDPECTEHPKPTDEDARP